MTDSPPGERTGSAPGLDPVVLDPVPDLDRVPDLLTRAPVGGRDVGGRDVGGRDMGGGAEARAGQHRVGRGRRRHRGRRARYRRLAAGVATALVVLVAMTAWVVVRGVLAKSRLDEARQRIAVLQRQVLSGDFPREAELRSQIEQIRRRATAARALTSDPVWSAFGRLPVAGCPMRSAATLIREVDAAAGTSLPAVADLGPSLDPRVLRQRMTINVRALAAVRRPAERSFNALSALRAAAENVPDCGWAGRVSGIADARAEMIDRSRRLAGALDTVVLAARVGPEMLGGGGVRRYLLIVQNPAESRANGGIIGGFGLLTAEHGRLSIDGISGNGALPGGPTQQRPATGLPVPFAARYGAFWPDRIWANINLTPDYPMAGRLYSAFYRAGTGLDVDGTISLDPTTLSYLLAASRPAVLPDGTSVAAGHLVDLVESRVYGEIMDAAARDRFFAQVGQAVYAAVESGAGDTTKLVTALGRAAREGRLEISSNHAEEQRILSSTALGGALPDAPGPFLGVVTQNATASKLDYWLRRQTTYRMQRQPNGAGLATITIRLTNAAPGGLPAYVRHRQDLKDAAGNLRAQNNLWLSVYTGRGSWLVAARLDGVPIGLAGGSESGHPVLSTYLTVDRGQTRTLEIKVREPVGGPALTVRPQPLPVAERLEVQGLPVVPPWSSQGSSQTQN
ncbi:hypothetical protein CcI6DRAFT_01243 [Frankia sp. CcI6]|uniref:DUF4012 domain-containing protein n=2 Tax=unclassified Frankia TaxID=2632575 RepID=UPI0003D04C92|nr:MULTISPECIES: DUF4012 domain-containing protein [unclassified Frankia]ETA03279.1 hypothetical protein CcI6DRAFT_01243 [Frankia sp. CcI6]